MRPFVRTAFSKLTLWVVHQRQRALALFFVAVMLTASLMPAGQVFAEAQQHDRAAEMAAKHDLLPPAAQDRIKPKDANADRPMKQDYAAGEKPEVSKQLAAAGTQAASNKLLGGALSQTAPVNGEILNGKLPDTPRVQPHELTDRRTAMSSETVNADGTITKKNYVVPQFFKKDGKWENIDNTLVEDKNAGDSGNPFGRALGQVQSWLSSTKNFQVEKNDWQARFSPSNAEQGMVRIKKGGSQVGFSPVGAKDVDPVITTNKDGKQITHYYDLWPGVDVSYVVENAAVKESISIKDKNATNKVSFRMLGGASISKRKNGDKQAESLVIKGKLDDQFEIAPAN